MKGYRWFVNEYLGSYEPHEETFNSIEEAMEDMKRYADCYSLECCGIDYVNDDDGSIDVIDTVIAPTAVFYPTWVDDDDF